MRNVSKIFIQLDFWQPASISLNVDSDERQPARKDSQTMRTYCTRDVLFHNIWDRQLEHNTYTQDVNKSYRIQEAADAVPVKTNAPLLHYVV